MLTFDAETHRYLLDGKPVPSVTGILKPLVDFSMVDPDVLRRAAAFGTAAHQMCAMAIAGTLDYGSLDDELLPVLEAFDAWRHACGDIASVLTGGTLDEGTGAIVGDGFAVEKPMGHKTLKFAGTPDIVIDGRLIIDIKTRAVKPLTDAIQCAGYEELWQANGGNKKAKYEHRILELRRDGTFDFVKVNHRQAKSRFRMLLDHYRTIEKIKSWKG